MTLSVTAAGMVTAVGFNYPASCAAIRAGISGVKQVNLWDPEAAEYITGAKVDLPHWWEGASKLADLVAPAIYECLKTTNIPPERIPILLGIAARDRPHRLPDIEDCLLDDIEFRLNLTHHPESNVIPRGNVSGVAAIQLAQRIIDARAAPACIVAGVDSFLQQEVVEAYMEQRRVLTPVNSNGFSPGEAGCAVLVEAPSGRRDEFLILGTGFGRESGTIQSDEPSRGMGLIQALRSALADAGATIYDTQYRIADLNGEHYKFKEGVWAEGRLMNKRYPGFYDLWHPIECVGEIGAAIVACILGVCRQANLKGYAPGPRALCHFSNDDEERAAMIVGAAI